MFKTILVPLDGSALAERALPFATRLATATGGRLILLYVRPDSSRADEPDFDVYGFAGTMRERRQAEAPTASRPVDVRALVREAAPEQVAEEICATSDNEGADIVVMSTHGRSGMGRWLYGSVADGVIRHARVPVLLISRACDRVWPEDGRLRILVPLDGSELAEAVLGPVGDLAASLQASLVLVSAVSPREYPPDEGVLIVRIGLDAELREAREYLREVATRLRDAGASVEGIAEAGRAGMVIDDVARQHEVDLIAMATHGRSGLARLALGSVATETLQRTTVPLLLTRPGI